MGVDLYVVSTRHGDDRIEHDDAPYMNWLRNSFGLGIWLRDATGLTVPYEAVRKGEMDEAAAYDLVARQWELVHHRHFVGTFWVRLAGSMMAPMGGPTYGQDIETYNIAVYRWSTDDRGDVWAQVDQEQWARHHRGHLWGDLSLAHYRRWTTDLLTVFRLAASDGWRLDVSS